MLLLLRDLCLLLVVHARELLLSSRDGELECLVRECCRVCSERCVRLNLGVDARRGSPHRDRSSLRVEGRCGCEVGARGGWSRGHAGEWVRLVLLMVVVLVMVPIVVRVALRRRDHCSVMSILRGELLLDVDRGRLRRLLHANHVPVGRRWQVECMTASPRVCTVGKVELLLLSLLLRWRGRCDATDRRRGRNVILVSPEMQFEGRWLLERDRRRVEMRGMRSYERQWLLIRAQ